MLVVTYIADDTRIVHYLLPASAETCPCSCVNYCIADGPAAIFPGTRTWYPKISRDLGHFRPRSARSHPQNVQCSKHSTKIPALVRAAQIHFPQHCIMLIPKPRFNLVRKSQQRHDCSTAAHEDWFRKIGIQNLAFKDRISFMIALPHNNRHSRLDDSSLFECYFRKGSAKKVTMIQPYVCNDTQDRSDNVRTVQAASQTGFKNDIIHPLTRKPV